MSFTHSCAHAHLIPIFPASERYHGSSIVPNKSSSVEGGSLSWQDLLASPRGRLLVALLWLLRAGAGSCLCPKALGSVPPHFWGQSLSFFRIVFQEDKAMQLGGREQIVGHLEGFQLMYSLSVCLERTLDLTGRWPGECKVCVTSGWPGLHSAQGLGISSGNIHAL